jgi:methylmalonyl-CoA/ethylmalonyl-CoA epimerase
MKLHHIAIVVEDVARSAQVYERLLGLKQTGMGGADPLQKVNALFLDAGLGEDVTLELLEPTADDSPISKSLQRGGGLHHLCFEVDDIDQELARIKNAGGNVVCEPVPAVGFNNRRIAFVFPVDTILVELVER